MSLRVNLEDQTPQKPMETLSRQRLLRKIAVTSTTLGFILNLVAILTVRHGGKPWRSAKTLTGWAFLPLIASLIWDLSHLLLHKTWKCHGYHQRSGDVLASLGFTAILITNGVVAAHLYHRPGGMAWIVLMTYNSFPWIICAITHIWLSLDPLLTNLIDTGKFPKIRLEWPEETHTLVAQEDDGYKDDDVNPSSDKKGTKHQEDIEDEAEPLLASH